MRSFPVPPTPEPASLSPSAVWTNYRLSLNQEECINPQVSLSQGLGLGQGR